MATTRKRPALMLGMDTSQRTLDRMAAAHARLVEKESVERPNQMSFGEQVVEALGEYVDAKLDYAEARRGPAAEYANGDPVDRTATRLQELLDRVRFAL